MESPFCDVLRTHERAELAIVSAEDYENISLGRWLISFSDQKFTAEHAEWRINLLWSMLGDSRYRIDSVGGSVMIPSTTSCKKRNNSTQASRNP